jgi:hypothetical protein
MPQFFVFEHGRSTCVVSQGSASSENGLHVAPEGQPSALYGPAFSAVAVQISAHWVGISASLAFRLPLLPCRRERNPVMQ